MLHGPTACFPHTIRRADVNTASVSTLPARLISEQIEVMVSDATGDLETVGLIPLANGGSFDSDLELHSVKVLRS